ncbi:MAG: chemotaxis protein CheW [Eubacteriales bacterium]|nr:chemotaxis protein CheW [Eubacteriales bacterium]
MAETVINEILCIPGKKRNYAVEFPYIEEICQSLQVSCIPCLPQWYCGMGNYKGMIIPVIRMERDEETGRRMIMVLKHEQFILGVEISPRTFIVQKSSAKEISRNQETGDAELWKEKELFMVDKELYSLIDVEKSLDNLVLYP